MHSGVRYVVEIQVMSYNKASTPREKVIIPGKQPVGKVWRRQTCFHKLSLICNDILFS